MASFWIIVAALSVATKLGVLGAPTNACSDGITTCAIQKRAGDANTTALVIPPSQYFEGNDGPWSTFFLRVGTPEQDVRVLVSTAASENIIVLSQYGCTSAVFSSIPPGCASSRGMMYTTGTSTTWKPIGNYSINSNGVGLEANLGYSQVAEYGLDTLGIGLVSGTDGPTLINQTVAGIATASPFYLGTFGLSTQPLNFSSLGNYSSPSFLTSLRQQNLIPSLSWSYTAGAIYRLKKVYGQLIFAGYDTSRFVANSVSFTMAEDITRDLVVSLQSITYTGSDEITLLSDPINIFIDSTDPMLWLPAKACRTFESAFGLTLDQKSNLYLVNESHHSSLVSENAEVSFRISDVSEGGDAVTITLPYSAFDLTAENPLVTNTSYYFPLREAANDSQYTLGRTFLQEAYLIADYERRTFNVSQCSWVEGATQNIVTITSKDAQPASSNTSTSTTASPTASASGTGATAVSSGAIAGGVVGGVALIGLIAGLIFLLRRRKKAHGIVIKDSKENEQVPKSPGTVSQQQIDFEIAQRLAVAELSKTHGELSGEGSSIYQLDGNQEGTDGYMRDPQIYELAGSMAVRSELDADSAVSSRVGSPLSETRGRPFRADFLSPTSASPLSEGRGRSVSPNAVTSATTTPILAARSSNVSPNPSELPASSNPSELPASPE